MNESGAVTRDLFIVIRDNLLGHSLGKKIFKTRKEKELDD
jgi:hypothetical protein